MKLREEPWENRVNITIASALVLLVCGFLTISTLSSNSLNAQRLIGLSPLAFGITLGLRGLWNRFDHAR